MIVMGGSTTWQSLNHQTQAGLTCNTTLKSYICVQCFYFLYQMKSITHSYFGFLDADALKKDDVIWEKYFDLNGETFEVALWAGSSANAEQQTIMLDAFEAFLQQLPAMDLLARQQLKHYLTENSDFIDFHMEEIPEDSDVLSQLVAGANGGSISASAFVDKMKLDSVGMWLQQIGMDDEPIIMDYMFAPENSDQILAVKFTLDRQLVTISWES